MIDIDRTRDLLDAIWNQRHLGAVDELYAENFVGHDPQNPLQGRDGVKGWVEETMTVAPDFHLDLHETIAEGDMAVTRWTASGTQRGEWRGIPPTNKSFVVTGMTMSKFVDGRIVESWSNSDTLGVLQQLGIVPEMAE